MATESILRPGELKEILLREIASADLATENVSEVGTVLEVRDGVARIYGLKSAIASEMLEFTAQETGDTVAGLVLNLEEDNVGAAVMGDYLKLKEGDEVRRTGRLLQAAGVSARKLVAVHDEAPVDAAPGPAAERGEARTAVRAALERLPLAQREAVVLAYWGGLTADEIARRAQVPLGTAKSRIRLGLARLRFELE